MLHILRINIGTKSSYSCKMEDVTHHVNEIIYRMTGLLQMQK